jgi:hypothetical protein
MFLVLPGDDEMMAAAASCKSASSPCQLPTGSLHPLLISCGQSTLSRGQQAAELNKQQSEVVIATP